MSLHKIQSFPFIAKFCLKVTKKFCTILKKIISDIIYLLIFGIYFVFVACLFHFYPLCGWVFSKQIFIEAWNNWILVFLRGSAWSYNTQKVKTSWEFECFTSNFHSANIYLFKAKNRITRKRCEIGSKLTIKTLKITPLFLWYLYCYSEHISHLC